MIKNKLRKRIVKLCNELKHIPIGKNKHITFILNKNNILSIGFNYYNKRPIECHKYGYGLHGLHSELDAILKYRHDSIKFTKCTLVNCRINRFGQLGMSKPCPICQKLIYSFGFKKMYYTNHMGEFCEEI